MPGASEDLVRVPMRPLPHPGPSRLRPQTSRKAQGATLLSATIKSSLKKALKMFVKCRRSLKHPRRKEEIISCFLCLGADAVRWHAAAPSVSRRYGAILDTVSGTAHSVRDYCQKHRQRYKETPLGEFHLGSEDREPISDSKGHLGKLWSNAHHC